MMKKALLLLAILATNTYALKDVDRAEFLQKNLLQNPGFERATAKWSNSGGVFNHTVTAAEVAYGIGAGEWDASASSQTLSSAAVAIPNGLKSQNCSAKMLVRGDASLYKLQAYDGSNVLNEVTMEDSSTDFREYSVTFVCPSSGNIQLRMESTGDGAEIHFDDAFLGLNPKLVNVAQAEVYGTLEYDEAASCIWSIAQTTYAADYAADTDCNAPTVTGKVAAPAAKTPGVQLNNAGPGKYVFHFEFSNLNDNAGGTSSFIATSTGSDILGSSHARSESGTSVNAVSVVGVLEVASSFTGEVRLRGRRPADNVQIINDPTTADRPFKVTVIRYPSESQLAVTPDFQGSRYYQAAHEVASGNVCSWLVNSSTYATPAGAANCAYTLKQDNLNNGSIISLDDGSVQPGIVWTPSFVEVVEICATFNVASTNGAGTDVKARMWDGTTKLTEVTLNIAVADASNVTHFCAPFTPSGAGVAQTISLQLAEDGAGSAKIENAAPATATHSIIEWLIKPMTNQQQTPLLVDSLNTPGSGASYQFFSAEINCSTGAEAIVAQHGSWLASIAYNGAGDCTLTYNSGLWGAKPHCTCSSNGNGIDGGCVIDSNSSSAVDIFRHVAGSGTDGNSFVQCHGPR